MLGARPATISVYSVIIGFLQRDINVHKTSAPEEKSEGLGGRPVGEGGKVLPRPNWTAVGSLEARSLSGSEMVGEFRPAQAAAVDWTTPQDAVRLFPENRDRRSQRSVTVRGSYLVLSPSPAQLEGLDGGGEGGGAGRRDTIRPNPDRKSVV